MVTVALGVVLHGASPIPLAARQGRRASRFEAEAPENRPAVEVPIRLGWSQYAEHIEERTSAWEARFRCR